MAKLFRGRFPDSLKSLYSKGLLEFSSSCRDLAQPSAWDSFINKLYEMQWCPYIKETFNGFDNAITHRIAITNSAIKSVTGNSVIFTAGNYKTGETEDVTMSCAEFVRRFLQHVLPSGFQKIRCFSILTDIIPAAWGHDIRRCPICGGCSMHQTGRSYNPCKQLKLK